MKKQILISTIALVGALGAVSALKATNPKAMTVREATRYCEEAIPKHCQNVTCAQFCVKAFERRRNKEQLIASCKAECKPENRCKLKPLGGRDDPGNRELDAQNRDQLMACIAQSRDPTGEKSGRRMQDWKEIQTPSWQKLMR